MNITITTHTTVARTIHTTHTLSGGVTVVWRQTVAPDGVAMAPGEGRVTLADGTTALVSSYGDIRGLVLANGKCRDLGDLPAAQRADLRERLRAAVREAGYPLDCDREARVERASEVAARIAELDADAAAEVLTTDGAISAAVEGRVFWRKDLVCGGVPTPTSPRELIAWASLGAETIATCEALAREILPGATVAWHVTDAAHVRATRAAIEQTRLTTREEPSPAERAIAGRGVVVAEVDLHRRLVVLRVAGVPA